MHVLVYVLSLYVRHATSPYEFNIFEVYKRIIFQLYVETFVLSFPGSLVSSEVLPSSAVRPAQRFESLRVSLAHDYSSTQATLDSHLPVGPLDSAAHTSLGLCHVRCFSH